jgi:hypothetical protein
LPNTNCSWLIRPAMPTAVAGAAIEISLTFINFDVEFYTDWIKARLLGARTRACVRNLRARACMRMCDDRSDRRAQWWRPIAAQVYAVHAAATELIAQHSGQLCSGGWGRVGCYAPTPPLGCPADYQMCALPIVHTVLSPPPPP